MTGRGLPERHRAARIALAVLAAAAPLLAAFSPLLAAAAFTAALLLAWQPGGTLLPGGLLVLGEVGATAGAGWALPTSILSAAALVALAPVPARRLAVELALGTAAAVIVNILPRLAPVPAVAAGLVAAIVLLMLLANAGRGGPNRLTDGETPLSASRARR